MTAYPCGFTWKTQEHICECIVTDEHEEYTNAHHVCECGERRDCERDELMYAPTGLRATCVHGVLACHCTEYFSEEVPF